MGLLDSFQTGISGLRSHGEALTVIGDNIANVGTTGYKTSRAEFSDVLAVNLKGILGGNQIGRGTKVRSVKMMPIQGALVQTDNATDLAISGDGLFVLKGPSVGQAYTRDGSFHFDKEGYLVNADGLRVQGYQADNEGKMTNMMGELKLPNTTIPSKSTDKVSLGMNLDSTMNNMKEAFDINNPLKTSNYSTGVSVYDSQGNKRLVTVFFHKSADNSWNWSACADAADSAQGGEAGKFVEMAAGTLGFTVDGKLNSQTTSKSAFNFNKGALPNQKIEFNFGDAITSDKGKGTDGTTQYSSRSEVYRQSINGYAAGTLTTMSFENDGFITGMYSNGRDMTLGQVALAKFDNFESLNKLGNNLLRESIDAGAPAIGAAGTGGRGKIYAKTLESSTTDIAKEFVNMMNSQRAFQANAKIISASDELMGEVIQLKR